LEQELIECTEAELWCARIIEACINREINMQSLGQWGQSLDSLRAIKKCRRACDEEVKPGEAACVHFID